MRVAANCEEEHGHSTSSSGNGFNEEELVQVYKAYIRPIADYAAVAWGLMITQEQSDKLEMYA